MHRDGAKSRVNNLVVSSPVSDFQIGEATFEVGGKSKGQKQLSSTPNGYVVKDDIEYEHANIVPL